MIVYDLRCEGSHVFEAWFGSSADYEDQRERGMIACPICGDDRISKALMAPNVAAKGNRAVSAPPASAAAPAPAAVKAALKALAAAQREALATSEWVGPRFAERARAMHDGDEPVVTIHGEATAAEARALVEEGVEVAPLLFPHVPPAARN